MVDAKYVGDDFSPPTEVDWSKFEVLLRTQPDSSQMQLSGSPGTPKFDKFYLIAAYDCDDDIEINSGYCVYRIDANSASNTTSLEPIISWDREYHRAFAIVGSKLYMFGGMNYDCSWTDNMSIYDMRTALSSSTTTRLDKESLQPGPQMSGCKCSPVAVVMGDSKICVFGSVLYISDQVGLFSGPSFELFDTRCRRWKVLPEPPIIYEDFESVHIQSYGVVHRSCLIIQTIQGIYGINVDNPSPKWVYLDGSERIGLFSIDGMWTMVDKKLCSPFKVMRRGDLDVYPIAFKAPTAKRESLISKFPSGVLCFDDRCNNLCIVRAGFHPYDIPNLLVDIVKFDDEALEKLGSYLSEWKEIQSDKSSTFALTFRPCEDFHLVACFAVKDTLEDDIWNTTGLQVALEPEALSDKLFVCSHKIGTKGNKSMTWHAGVASPHKHAYISGS